MDNGFTKRIIKQALLEDIHKGDLTTNILIPQNKKSEAYIIAKEDAVICGLDIVKQVFRALDKNMQFSHSYKDGDHIQKNSKVLRIKGKARAILTGERVALNFLSHLSGIATKTNHFVNKTRSFKAKIFDTRKTIPGLRQLQKYAVRCGGGYNHRLNLHEMILIKDNHPVVLNSEISLKSLSSQIKKITTKPVEIEVDSLKKLKEALSVTWDFILLDNMSLNQIRQAVQLVHQAKIKKRPLLEVSGGVTFQNVRAIAKTGIDRISVGALTHSAAAIDFSLEVNPR